ncbi:MAG: leucyl aminopeptidase [Alphaproteobacteria bacterium]|nr:leucyl aminopeptidase [Alphaproteobacteria bacterium]
MDIRYESEARGDAVAVMAGEGGALMDAGRALDEQAKGALTKAMKTARFKGGPNQVVEILAPANLEFGRVLIIGVGDPEKANALTVERWGAQAVRRTLTTGAEALALLPEAIGDLSPGAAAAHAAFGARLGAYRFDAYRTKLKPEQKPSLKNVNVQAEKAPKEDEAARALAQGIAFARLLVSEPPNVLHPEEYAARLSKLEEHGLDVEVLGEKQLAALGMNALLGVGRGSARETQLVVMRWNGGKKSEKPIAFVGKGVTFDTGGISLKPGAGMDEMKGDMGGSAAVCGAMLTLALRKAKANVVGIVGLVENMPDGKAQRPGDIVAAADGQTIEVLNTDAEGRLVLADAVWYAQEKHQPSAMIDLATLTGAVIVALGHEYAGMYANDDALAAALETAGAAEGEHVWRMPLAPAYDKMIDSPNADMKNIAGKPAGGSIIGAQFIKRFVREGQKWAHLDIAGTAWKPAPYDDPLSPAWATGWGVRILNRFVKDRE